MLCPELSGFGRLMSDLALFLSVQESLEALRSLPEGTLFDEGAVSSVWLEVVERATKFLRSVVEGYVWMIILLYLVCT